VAHKLKVLGVGGSGDAIIDREWQRTSEIPSLRSWRQEYHRFKASLGYKSRPLLKKM
jgi:hypothetical protein